MPKPLGFDNSVLIKVIGEGLALTWSGNRRAPPPLNWFSLAFPAVLGVALSEGFHASPLMPSVKVAIGDGVLTSGAGGSYAIGVAGVPKYGLRAGTGAGAAADMGATGEVCSAAPVSCRSFFNTGVLWCHAATAGAGEAALKNDDSFI
jgi:hypothetical protein